MRVVFFLVIILTLSSCATKKRSEGKDIDDIRNLDFKQETPVRYNKNKDYYNIFNTSDSLKDSLIEETIHRTPNMELEEIESGVNEISQLARFCYNKKFKKAFVVIDNLYRRYQKHSGYWNQVGNCYLLKGELRKADLFYRQSLKYNKNYAPVYNNFGSLHIRRKEYEKALAAFKKAHELNRSSLTPSYNLAQMYLNFGVVGKAQKLLLAIENQRSGDPLVLGALGTTYLFQGNIKKSLFYFNQISDEDRKHPSVGLNYVVALVISGDKELAEEILDDVDNDQKEWKKYYQKVSSFMRKQ